MTTTYEYFAASMALQKRLKIAKKDVIQIKKILREIIVDDGVSGVVREMAEKLLASYTTEVPDVTPPKPRKKTDQPDIRKKRRA